MAGVNTLSSKISTTESPPRLRSLPGVSTSVLGAVGITERGPFKATLVSSFDEYTQIFGGDTLDSDLTHAIRGFFENGGRQVYIQRVAHFTDISNDATNTATRGTVDVNTEAGGPTAARVLGTINAPFVLAAGDSLSLDVDGGGTAVATFDAAAATMNNGGVGPFPLANGETIIIAVDGGAPQTITFSTAEFVDIANATALEIAAVMNAQLNGASVDLDAGQVRVTSDTQGTGSSLEVTGGTVGVAFNAYPAGVQAGTGDVVDIAAVTFAEAKALIEADVPTVTVLDGGSGKLIIQSLTTGAASAVQVLAVSTADAKMGLPNAAVTGTTGAAAATFAIEGKTEGAYANDLTVIVSDATNGETDSFNLTVEDDGNIVETFVNLNMTPTSASFITTVLAATVGGSNYVRSVATGLGVRPGNGTYGPLTGGGDGLVGLDDNDFLGSSLSKTGLRGFDTAAISLLIVPGRVTPAVQQGMLTYCEQTRCMDCFAILDATPGTTTTQVIDYLENTAGLLNFSEFGAFYYPNVKVLNPDQELFGTEATITVPPSGHIAGVYARTDARRIGGVYDAPAGEERGKLFGVFGYDVEDTEESGKRDLLYPKRINPLSVVNGLRVIDGVRTLKNTGSFPSVSERRGVIFIEQTIKNGLEFARFANNDATLRAAVTRTVRLFLINQMRVGAFRSRVPDEAFFIDFTDALNTPSVVCEGRLLGQVGLATQKPAEFIIIDFSQDTRAKEAEALGG